MPIFYEVATLQADRPTYAVVKIDTDKKVGNGVEGIVVSQHPSRDEADAVAYLASNSAGRA